MGLSAVDETESPDKPEIADIFPEQTTLRPLYFVDFEWVILLWGKKTDNRCSILNQKRNNAELSTFRRRKKNGSGNEKIRGRDELVLRESERE